MPDAPTPPVEEPLKPQPTATWLCRCDATIERYRGSGDITCTECGQEFNAFGQRLRDDWRSNPSNRDEEISDLEGYEMAHVEDW